MTRSTETSSNDGSSALDRIGAVVDRELTSVRRTRTYGILSVALFAVTAGVGVAGGGVRDGYVPLIVDLLLPVELIVPVIAFAFGYRAILTDADSGELDVLRTYPLDPLEYVIGIYVGRAVGVLVAVLVPLSVLGVIVPLFPADVVSIYATHQGIDSPIAYLRFVVLTGLFALAVLAVAIAVSAVARSLWSALALGVAVGLGFVIGFDLLLVSAFESIGDGLPYLLALSPNGAYRGLVLEVAVGVPGPRATTTAGSVIGLVTWIGVGIATATIALLGDRV